VALSPPFPAASVAGVAVLEGRSASRGRPFSLALTEPRSMTPGPLRQAAASRPPVNFPELSGGCACTECLNCQRFTVFIARWWLDVFRNN
jgi:hypothetical protein